MRYLRELTAHNLTTQLGSKMVLGADQAPFLHKFTLFSGYTDISYFDRIDLDDGFYNTWHGGILVINYYNRDTSVKNGVLQINYSSTGMMWRKISITDGEPIFYDTIWKTIKSELEPVWVTTGNTLPVLPDQYFVYGDNFYLTTDKSIYKVSVDGNGWEYYGSPNPGRFYFLINGNNEPNLFIDGDLNEIVSKNNPILTGNITITGDTNITAPSLFTKSINLFNKTTISVNKNLNLNNGELYTISDFYTSDFIPVLPETTYVRSFKNPKYFCFYDQNKNYIFGNTSDTPTITTSIETYYIKVSMRYSETQPDSYMFILGSSLPDKYYPYYLTENSLVGSSIISNRWFGKNVAVLGDSITEGYIPRNYQTSLGLVNVYVGDPTVYGVNTNFSSDMIGGYIVINGESKMVDGVVDEYTLIIESEFSREYVNSLYTIQYSLNGYPGTLIPYCSYLEYYLGCNVYNYGISGSLIGKLNSGTSNTFEERYEDMTNVADLIIVMGGTNDIRNNMPLGTMSDRTQYTFYGGLHRLCQGLITKYKLEQNGYDSINKQLLFMTPLHNGVTYGSTYSGGTFQDFATAIKNVCAYYSIPVFDMMNNSGLVPHEFKTLYGWQDGYTSIYNPLMPDGTHPSQDGHKIMAKKLSQFLSNL